jgi:hypothetical protein
MCRSDTAVGLPGLIAEGLGADDDPSFGLKYSVLLQKRPRCFAHVPAKPNAHSGGKPNGIPG